MKDLKKALSRHLLYLGARIFQHGSFFVGIIIVVASEIESIVYDFYIASLIREIEKRLELIPYHLYHPSAYLYTVNPFCFIM